MNEMKTEKKYCNNQGYQINVFVEPVCGSMSSSNCCFLTCIQISQEADPVVWYSHLFQNFSQLIVIHIVKGFVLHDFVQL